jgi:hypothetical protein
LFAILRTFRPNHSWTSSLPCTHMDNN